MFLWLKIVLLSVLFLIRWSFALQDVYFNLGMKTYQAISGKNITLTVELSSALETVQYEIWYDLNKNGMLDLSDFPYHQNQYTEYRSWRDLDDGKQDSLYQITFFFASDNQLEFLPGQFNTDIQAAYLYNPTPLIFLIKGNGNIKTVILKPPVLTNTNCVLTGSVFPAVPHTAVILQSNAVLPLSRTAPATFGALTDIYGKFYIFFPDSLCDDSYSLSLQSLNANLPYHVVPTVLEMEINPKVYSNGLQINLLSAQNFISGTVWVKSAAGTLQPISETLGGEAQVLVCVQNSSGMAVGYIKGGYYQLPVSADLPFDIFDFADVSFYFSNKPENIYVIQNYFSGAAPNTSVDLIVAYKDQTIQGKVMVDSIALAGQRVTVEAIFDGNGNGSTGGGLGIQQYEATTDQNGFYKIGVTAAVSNYKVTLQNVPDYVSGGNDLSLISKTASGNSTVDFFLEPSPGSISGYALERISLKPIPNAFVKLEYFYDDTAGVIIFPPHGAYTDLAGWFLISIPVLDSNIRWKITLTEAEDYINGSSIDSLYVTEQYKNLSSRVLNATYAPADLFVDLITTDSMTSVSCEILVYDQNRVNVINHSSAIKYNFLAELNMNLAIPYGMSPVSVILEVVEWRQGYYQASGVHDTLYYSVETSADMPSAVISIVWDPVRYISIKNNPGNAVVSPHALRLFNTPNPFNFSTVIDYQIPQQYSGKNFVLRIYQPDGRLMRELVRGAQWVGTHQLRWDGKKNSGEEAPAGIYVLQLSGEGFQVQRKIILLK